MLFFRFGFFFGLRCSELALISSFDHTTVDIPYPIRTAKSSTVGPNQYCGGGLRGNLGCRMFFALSFLFVFFKLSIPGQKSVFVQISALTLAKH